MPPPPPPDSPLHLLHVLDARDGVEPLLTALAARSIPARHDVLLIGTTRDERHAALLGLVTTDRLSPSGGPAALLLRLRRLARDRLAAAPAHTPILLAHGPRAAIAARYAVPRRIPMLATLPRAPLAPRQRLALALEDDVALTFDPDIAAAWRSAGLHDVRILPVPSSALPTPSRDDLRARLNIESDVIAVATLADPPSAGDARRLASLTGFLYTMGYRSVGVAPRSAGLLRRGAHFIRLHGRRWGILPVDLPLPALLPACELVVPDSIEPTTLGPALIRAAQYAGAAVVVPQAPWLHRLMPDSEACRTLFTPNTTTLTVVHRLGHLSESPASLAAARAASQRCADPAGHDHFPRELARLIGERLNLPSGSATEPDAAEKPRFVPAADAAAAGAA